MKRSGSLIIKIIDGLTNNKGTTLVEYGLVLLLIAIVVVLAVKMVGESTNKMYSIANTAVTNAGS